MTSRTISPPGLRPPTGRPNRAGIRIAPCTEGPAARGGRTDRDLAGDDQRPGIGDCGPTSEPSLRPLMSHVDDDAAMRARAGKSEDSERQPGSDAKSEGRVSLEGAAIDQVAQSSITADVGNVVAHAVWIGHVSGLHVVGVLQEHNVQTRPPGWAQDFALALTDDWSVVDLVAGGGAIEGEHHAAIAVVLPGPG